MTHKSIERIERPVEKLSYDFLVNAYNAHTRWLWKNRGERVNTPLGSAHIERAASLAAEASWRAHLRGSEAIFSRMKEVHR